MPKDEQNNEGGNTNSYLKYSGMGFQMIVIIGGFTFAGYKIDKGANHKVQWVTATLALVGVFVSLYIVIRSVRND